MSFDSHGFGSSQKNERVDFGVSEKSAISLHSTGELSSEMSSGFPPPPPPQLVISRESSDKVTANPATTAGPKPRRKLPEVPPRQISGSSGNASSKTDHLHEQQKHKQKQDFTSNETSLDLDEIVSNGVDLSVGGQRGDLEDKFEIFSRFLQSHRAATDYTNKGNTNEGFRINC